MLLVIILLPLIGCLINGLFYKGSARVAGIIATAAIFGSFIISLFALWKLGSMAPEHRLLEESVFSWIQTGNLKIDFMLRFDSLSAVFVLVISGIGALIHAYSIGYMERDTTPWRFFAYLNLFCFAMLVLVLGASLPVLFLGWEGVGLCSYLLIGYWYSDPLKASAGKKAFIVNRVGDLGFLLGMFLVYKIFGTMDFVALRGMAGSEFAKEWATYIGLLFFLGCVGKSAQIPLHVWLPDAMAGPTPVSALIHAATMVTAGIYLVARLDVFYVLSPVASGVVAWVGVITALFAGLIAIAQRDIKKVLAYSTISQLGLMFLACGVGAPTAAVFHVVTHAFFKALLFLGAGSIIHALGGEQDLLKMGGLRAKLPQTTKVMAIGALAICGIPPLSGFFSKDEILWRTFSAPEQTKWLFVAGVVASLLTVVYTSRLFVLAFLGEASVESKNIKVHEAPKIMLVPLWLLAGLTAVGGLFGLVYGEKVSGGVAEWFLMVTLALASAGAMWGVVRFKNRVRLFHSVLENKFYVDEAYDKIFVQPLRAASVWLWRVIDVGVIDRFVHGLGALTVLAGGRARRLQSGSLQLYAAALAIGLILLSGVLIYGLV